MFAPDSIMETWGKFDDFPMETLTKVWFYNKGTGKKQRDVSLMREHREQYGLSGNCFDLALWLLDEFKKDGIEAYPVGHDLNTVHAHAAVIAISEDGGRYFCDLGDQWIMPILIDIESEDFSGEKLGGFFPAADVQVQNKEDGIEILYHRPNGKISKQLFDMKPIEKGVFLQAADRSQNLIKPVPLLECRLPYEAEIAHWEFYDWESFLSTKGGRYIETKTDDIDVWTEKIHEKTGYDKGILLEVLKRYKTN